MAVLEIKKKAVRRVAIQRLIEAIDGLIGVHEELLTLAEQKRVVLVRNEVNELSAIVNKENKLVRSIDGLLREQTDATNQFFREKGFQPTRSVTAAELSRMVTDLKQKSVLDASRVRLMKLVTELKRKNDLNQQLIQQSLAFIDYSINLMVGTEEEPTYAKPSTASPRHGGQTGYFDSKA